ncbi:uncharacterized protein [Nicotiana sylvestris]|uniref:uncharacterized protein n=1 Tax=Nicotiana sylvestris TaxID=4096 RepID=UPI00388CEC56
MVQPPGIPPPSLPARGGSRGARGGGRGIIGEAKPEAEASDVVITGTVLVCTRDVSVLFDPGSTYPYVSSYFATYLVLPSDSLSAPVYVSTPVGDSIMIDRVHRSCIVVIGGLEARVDLLLLVMVDFDVIFGMDWLSPYHATLDCHAKTVTLALLGVPRLEWRGTPGHSTRSVISYMNARRIVEKGCLAYLAYVRDSSVEVPSMDYVPVICEFSEVFPLDLLGMPSDMDINFCIDLAPGTQPISIPSYRIASPELKELKDQLQDLIEKGFIRPSVFPWGCAGVLC